MRYCFPRLSRRCRDACMMPTAPRGARAQSSAVTLRIVDEARCRFCAPRAFEQSAVLSLSSFEKAFAQPTTVEPESPMPPPRSPMPVYTATVFRRFSPPFTPPDARMPQHDCRRHQPAMMPDRRVIARRMIRVFKDLFFQVVHSSSRRRHFRLSKKRVLMSRRVRECDAVLPMPFVTPPADSTPVAFSLYEYFPPHPPFAVFFRAFFIFLRQLFFWDRIVFSFSFSAGFLSPVFLSLNGFIFHFAAFFSLRDTAFH